VESKENEERYRLLAENVTDLIGALDMNLNVTYMSPSIARYFGFGPELAIGKQWKDYINTALTPASARIAERKVDEILTLSRQDNLDPFQSWLLELEFNRGDGTTVWTEGRISILRDPDGKPAELVGIVRDIDERKKAEDALKRSESQLRLLSRRVLEVQEEERSRIARELHDQLGQELVALKIEAVSLAERLEDSQLHERAGSVLSLVEQLDATAHRIAVSLRPEILDELGLVRAIQWFAEDFERRSGVSCPVESPVGELSLPKPIATCAYRILQEALTNVWKHAKASQVKIKVSTKDDILFVSIADNGVGVDLKRLSDATSLGLLGMRERARLVGGKLDLRSNRRGKGFVVTAQLPMVEGEDD